MQENGSNKILSEGGHIIKNTVFSDPSFLERLAVATYICDENGFVTAYNSAAVTLWGRTPAIGQDLWCGSWKIYYPDGSPMPLDDCPMAVTLKEGKAVTGEEIIIERPDGTRRYVNPNPQPFFDTTGKLTGAINILLDISDRKSSEEKAGKLAAIVESSDDAIVSKTLDGIVTSWNGAAQKMFGYTEEEMIGQPITKLCPPDRLDEEPKILERLKKGLQIAHFETKRVTKNNEILDVSLSISPVKDSKGNIIGASKIARNITGEKEAERLLREGEERFRMAVESTMLGTWEYYLQTDEFVWSGESAKIWGIGITTKINYRNLLRQVHPADRDLVKSAVFNAMNVSEGGNYDVLFRIHRYGDEKIRWIRTQGKVFFRPDEKPERFIGTMLDITDEKTAKEDLERTVAERTSELVNMNRKLERSNHELEQFAYIASHDLQEPLRKIQTFSALLHDRPEDKQLLRKYLPKINIAAEHMSRLIRDVLGYSRLSQTDIQFEDVDLMQVISDVLMEFDLLIEQKKAVILYDDLPVVKGVTTQLNQLFRNLLGNALKFCDQDPVIRISARMCSAADLSHNTPGKDGQRFAEICFKDNGIGFAQHHAEQIFNIFKRLNSTETYSGTGIGLAMCKRIVENHGGQITARSEPEEGATFIIHLPC